MSNDYLKNFLELPRENLSPSEIELLAGLEQALKTGNGKKALHAEKEVCQEVKIAFVRWLSAKEKLTDSEKELASSYMAALEKYEKILMDKIFEKYESDTIDEELGINFITAGQENTQPALPQTREEAIESFLIEERDWQRYRESLGLDTQLQRLGLRAPLPGEQEFLERMRKRIESDPSTPKLRLN